MAWSNEFKVGLFVLVAGVLTIGATGWAVDGLLPTDDVYHLNLRVPSADGLWQQSQIKLAGVSIGSISEIRVVGDHAELELAILDDYPLLVGTEAKIQSSGIIGDRYIGIVPGPGPGQLADGDWIRLQTEPVDYEKLTKQVELISEDVKAITGALRLYVENDQSREHVESTLANIDALSEELRLIAEQNRHDVNAIVDSVRRLSATLEDFAKETQGDVDEEMEKIKETTDRLNATVADIQSITGKIDEGEGTIGALVNDRETVDLLNETISNANSVIEGFSGMHTDVYYTGRYYVGTQPCAGGGGPRCAGGNPFFYGNPLASAGSNTVGLRLQPQEDFWYFFEINDYPQGTVTYTEHYYPETGQVYTEWEREPDYRFTFMMEKRWKWYSLRLGVREDGGGVGATAYLFRDRLELQMDAFDFDLGSYPALGSRGTPNLRTLLRLHPYQHVYFEVGNEQPLLGLQYGYVTGFAGAGFHFTDDDIRLIFATLPLGF